MILETKRWIQKHYPYWDRRGGRDHIWLFTHDEGACWVPNEVTPSIWLTHWGRMELNHTSNTAFPGDDYNQDHKSFRMPDGWHVYFKGHACYDPEKVGAMYGGYGHQTDAYTIIAHVKTSTSLSHHSIARTL